MEIVPHSGRIPILFPSRSEIAPETYFGPSRIGSVNMYLFLTTYLPVFPDQNYLLGYRQTEYFPLQTSLAKLVWHLGYSTGNGHFRRNICRKLKMNKFKNSLSTGIIGSGNKKSETKACMIDFSEQGFSLDCTGLAYF